MKHLALYLALPMLIACGGQSNPIDLDLPAGKVAVDSPSTVLIVSWDCADTETVWTIFYGPDYRFIVDGENVKASRNTQYKISTYDLRTERW